MNRFPAPFLLAAALLLAARAALAHSATDPVPRTDDWWTKRHESFNQRVKEVGAKAEVIFVGDSITQGWEGEGKDAWAKFFGPRHAVNLGIGGDRTQHVLWRLDHGNLDGLRPKAAVVMIGTNNSNGEDNSVEQIADGVTAIVKKLRTALPGTKVLLIPIFPRGETPNPQRGKINQVNQILQRLVDGDAVRWVDFGYRFVDGAGRIPKDLMPDFLHLSPAAYQIWAESLEPHLVAALGGVAAAGGAGLTGEWDFTIPGPDGNPVTFPMVLEQAGEVLKGKFARQNGGWMNLENGKLNGNEFSWIVKRDRPDGSLMTYRMSGSVKPDGTLAGQAKTVFDGNEMDAPWTAKRK
ncbi:MAG: platelet-activating factor acetylhydrolase IB subunit [Limisphaerales bacterium]